MENKQNNELRNLVSNNSFANDNLYIWTISHYKQIISPYNIYPFEDGDELYWKIEATDTQGNLFEYPSDNEFITATSTDPYWGNEGWATSIIIRNEENLNANKSFWYSEPPSGAITFKMDGDNLKIYNNTPIWYTLDSVSPSFAMDGDKYLFGNQVSPFINPFIPTNSFLDNLSISHILGFEKCITLFDVSNESSINLIANRKSTDALIKNVLDMIYISIKPGLPAILGNLYKFLELYWEVEDWLEIYNLVQDSKYLEATGKIIDKFLKEEGVEKLTQYIIDKYIEQGYTEAAATELAGPLVAGAIDVVSGLINRTEFLASVFIWPDDQEYITLVKESPLELVASSIPGTIGYTGQDKLVVNETTDFTMTVTVPSGNQQPYFKVYAEVNIYAPIEIPGSSPQLIESTFIPDYNPNGGLNVNFYGNHDTYEQGTIINPQRDNNAFGIKINDYNFHQSSTGYNYKSTFNSYYIEVKVYQGGYPGQNPYGWDVIVNSGKIPFHLFEPNHPMYNPKKPFIIESSKQISPTDVGFKIDNSIDSDIEFYRIYRKLNNEQSYSLLLDENNDEIIIYNSTNNELFFVEHFNTPQTQVAYKVQAVDISGNESELSDPIEIDLESFEPVLNNYSISPNSGYLSDNFNFSVTYKSPGNIKPDEINLIINNISHSMTPQGDNWDEGVQYTYISAANQFSLGTHAFHFEGSQGGNPLRYPATGELSFIVKECNIAPTITLTKPNGEIADDVFVIQWTDDDPDDNAEIVLYWDTDNTSYNGTIINMGNVIYEDDDDFYAWDITGMQEGQTVWVYAVIADNEADYKVYSPGTLTIDHPDLADNFEYLDRRYAESEGDGDGVVESGESFDYGIKIRNTSGEILNNVTATVTSVTSGITVDDNEVWFGTIESGESVWSSERFDFTASAGFTGTVNFNVRLTYKTASNNPYYEEVTVPSISVSQNVSPDFSAGNIEIMDDEYYCNEDGIIQSGENKIRFRVQLNNEGNGKARNVWASPVRDDVYQISDREAEYPNIDPGHSEWPLTDEYFYIYKVPINFSGNLPVHAEVQWGEDVDFTQTINFTVPVEPAPWISYYPKSFDFGVHDVGDTARVEIKIENAGTSVLTVTDISDVSNNENNWIEGITFPVDINPGDSLLCDLALTRDQAENVTETFRITSNSHKYTTHDIDLFGTFFSEGASSHYLFEVWKSDSELHDNSEWCQVGDFDNDGLVDIASLDRNDEINIWEQDEENSTTFTLKYSFVEVEEYTIYGMGAGNCDGDDYGDIIFRVAYYDDWNYHSWIKVIEASGNDTYSVVWTSSESSVNSYTDCFTVGNCDSDANDEIIIGGFNSTETEQIEVYNSTGNNSYGKTWGSEDQLEGYDTDVDLGIVRVGDIYKDGVPEIILTCEDEWLFVLSNNGLEYTVSGHQFVSGSPSWSDEAYPAVGDLDNDGTNEIVLGSDRNGWEYIVINPTNWSIEWHCSPDIYSDGGLGIIGDFNNDGSKEYIVGETADNKLLIFESITANQYAESWNSGSLVSGNKVYNVVNYNLDGDGNDEIILSNYYHLSIWKHFANLPDLPELSINSESINIGDGITEGDTVNIELVIYNKGVLSASDVNIELYLNYPDAGKLLKSWTISTISENSYVPLNRIWVPDTSGTIDLFVKINYSGEEISKENNIASTSVSIQDNDVDSPVLVSFFKTEKNGDGDGVLEDNEMINFTFNVNDESGLSLVYIKIKNDSLIATGTYPQYKCTLGPMARGSYPFELGLIDGDDTPESYSLNDTLIVYEHQPIITSTYPRDGSTLNSVQPGIEIYFDSELIETSLNISSIQLLENHNNILNLVDLSYNPESKTILLSPPELSEHTEYTIRVLSSLENSGVGIKDILGNGLDTNYEWSFKTIDLELMTDDLIVRYNFENNSLNSIHDEYWDLINHNGSFSNNQKHSDDYSAFLQQSENELQYFEIPEMTIDMGQAFTICGWFRWDGEAFRSLQNGSNSETNRADLINQSYSGSGVCTGGGARRWGVSVNNDIKQISFDYHYGGCGSEVQSTKSEENIFSENEWNWFCVVHDGTGKLDLYFNNTLVASRTNHSLDNSEFTAPLLIGAWHSYYYSDDYPNYDMYRYFSGYLDDFYIFSCALNPTQRTKLYSTGQSFLCTSNHSLNFTENEETVTIDIINCANDSIFNWTIINDFNWIHTNKKAGVSGEQLSITVDANNSFTRAGSIIIFAEGIEGSPVKITIEQTGNTSLDDKIKAYYSFEMTKCNETGDHSWDLEPINDGPQYDLNAAVGVYSFLLEHTESQYNVFSTQNYKSIDLAQPFSFCGWFNYSTPFITFSNQGSVTNTTKAGIIGQGETQASGGCTGNGSRHWALQIDSDSKRLEFIIHNFGCSYDNRQITLSNSGIFESNSWYWFCVTHDGSGNLNIYLNNQLVATRNDHRLDNVYFTTPFWVGTSFLYYYSDLYPNYNVYRTFSGYLDDLYYFNQPLNYNEREYLYSYVSNLPQLCASKDTLNFNSFTGSSKLSIINCGKQGIINWKVIEDLEWVEVSPDSGIDEQALSINVTKNTGEARTGNITITAQNAIGTPKRIVINQLGGTLTTQTYEFSQSGWYLVSLSVVSDSTSVSALFPDAMGQQAYEWDLENLQYNAVSALETGKAYWIGFPSPSSTTIEGIKVLDYQQQFRQAGWYMVPAPANTTLVVNLVTNPAGRLATPVYGWDAGLREYAATDTLFPGYGYWFAILGACELTVGEGGLAKNSVKDHKNILQSFMPPGPPVIDGGPAELMQVPDHFVLEQNYPNPFNPITKIRYGLPNANNTTIQIYDILGRKVRTLLDENQSAGYHEVIWDAHDDYGNKVATGVYFYRIQVKSYSDVKKLLILK